MENVITNAELLAQLEQANARIAVLEAAQVTEGRQYPGEVHLLGLLDSTPDAMIIADVDGTILMVNEQTEKTFGYSQDELIGAPVERLLPTHLHERHKNNRAQYVEEPRFVTAGVDRKILAVRKDGETFPAEISLSHHSGTNGARVVLAAIRDVTERMRAEELVEAQRDLARLMSARLTADEVLVTCLETVLRVSGLDSGGIYLLNEQTRALELACHTGLRAEFVAVVSRYAEETPSAQAVLGGKILYLDEAELSATEYHAREGLRAVAVIPIQHHGEILGCLNLASHTATTIPDHTRRVIETIAFEVGNNIAHYRTEESLRISREQLSRALIAAKMGTWHYHLSTRRMTWSPEAARIFGIDITWNDFSDVLARFHPDDRTRVVTSLQEAMVRGVMPGLEYRIFDADGDIHWITNYGHVEYGSDGAPVAFSGIVQDITERKQIEAALEAESVRRRILFDESPDGILIIDPQTAGFIEFNTTAHLQLGYTREEFARLHIFDVDAQERADETHIHISNVIQSGKADFETVQRTRQGELRSVHVTAQIVDILGERVYYCTWRDITERKRAEEARRESDERYHLLFESMVQGVVFQDEDGHIIQANPAAERILGLSFDQMQGRTSVDPRWHSVHEDGSAYAGNMHPAMVALQTGKIVENVVMGVFNSDTGSYRWINISAVPRFMDGKEKPYQVFTTFEDITERKLAEQSLLEKLRLQEQLEKTASIAPGMLHIFKQGMDGSYSMPYASNAIEEIYGLSPLAVKADMAPIFSRIDVSDVPGVQATIEESAHSMTPWREEFRYHHPHKGVRWFSGHSTPVRESDGSILWYGVIEDITERKFAEAQLRESEQKYRDLLDGMNDTVWVIDFDMSILDCNLAATAVLGYTRDELLSMKIATLDTALRPEQIQALIDRLPGENLQVFETEHVRKDGSLIPVEVSSSLISYMGKTVVMSIARDITDRKQAQSELAGAERRYRALIENAPDGIVLISMTGKFKYFSPSVHRIFGYAPGEALTKEPADMTHPDDLPKVLVALESVLADSTKLPTLEYRFLHKSGEWRWIESTFSNLLAIPGVEAIIINFRDIHERKLAEEALRKSQALLTEAQRVGRIGHMEWNGRDAALVCSEELYEIFGLPLGAPVTQDTFGSMMSPWERDQIYLQDMQAFQQRRDLDYEFRIHLPDGSERWIHQIGKVAYGEDGLPTRMLAIVQDVSERKQVEDSLRKSRSRLEMALIGANAAMWDWNIVTGEAIFNDRWAGMVGYTLAELEPISIQTWVDLCHPEDLKKSDELLQRHFAGETEYYQCEVRMKHRNGSWIWAIDRGKVLEWDADGKPLRMFGTHLDITERKREEHYTEASLRLVSQSYKSLDVATFLRAVLDEAEALTDSQVSFFHFVDDDQNTISLQAWSTNTLDFMCTAEGQGEHYPVAAAGVWADAVRVGEPRIYNDYISLPHRRELPEGHAPVTRLITMPIKRGDLIVAVIGVGNKPQAYDEHDLDAVRRLSEDAFDIILRKRAEMQLRESEERFRTVADYTYDMEYWLDGERQFFYVSPSCERVTGYTREELLRDPSLLYAMVHPDDIAEYEQHIANEFSDPAPISVDFRIITADGEVRWINHTCQGVFGDDGQPRGRRASNRDITGRKQSEEQIRQQMEDLALVNMLNDAANRGESLEKIAELLSEEFQQIFRCTGASVYLLSPDQQMLDLQYTSMLPEIKQRIEQVIGRPLPRVQIPIGSASYFVDVINSERGLVTSDPQTLRGWMSEFASTTFLSDEARPAIEALMPEISGFLDIRSMITMPLKSAGRTLGAIQVSSRSLLTEQDLDRLQNVRASLTEILRRKLVEQELMESEEKYRGLMESLDNAVSTVRDDGTFMYMNDNGAAILGGTPHELIGRNMLELFPEPLASRQLAVIQDVFRTDRASIFEAQSIGRQGVRWYRFSLQPLHDEKGGVAQVLINATDIDSLKMAQQDLQELNRTLEERVNERTAEVQDLYDNAPTGYHSLSAEGKYTAINQTELKWLGYAPDEILGHTFSEFVTEQSARLFQTAFQTLVREGKVSDLEYEMRRKDGSVFPVMLNAVAIYGEDGRYLSSRSTMVDITRRKLAESELQRSVNFITAMLEAIPTPVFYKDNKGRYLGCNRAFGEFMGVSADGIRGKTVHQLWPSEQAEIYHEKDLELMHSQARQVYEASVIDSQGRTCPVIFVKDIFFDEGGQVAGMVGAFVDITEHKIAEDALRHANLELARAMRMKDEFLANMSHELRTPLNGILGLSEALQLQTYGALSDRQLRAIRNIESSGHHLLSLINDILDLSKIGAGKLEINLEPVSVVELCQASLAFVKQPAINKGIGLAFIPDQRARTVQADERRLKQVLVNLLSNAVKFTQANGHVTLQVQANGSEHTVDFSVIDTGIGISPEDLARLFSPFTQVDSSLTRQHEGTGLGLVLVKELTELHGGAVRVVSAVGKGSTFTVSLPWQPEPAQFELQGGSEAAAVRAPDKLPQNFLGTILLAEDKELNIMTIGDFLESQGYQVIYALTGYEAIEKTQKYMPDLILMDVQMPDLDGLDATRRLRADPQFADLPIVALTAMAMTGDRERCLNAGATDYVSKPVRLKELAELIKRLLEKKRTTSQ